MIYSQLMRSNIRISKIGLGTVQFGIDYGFTKAKAQEKVDKILNKVLELGINFIDTARVYGDSESKIGNFIKNNPQNNFIIATKIAKINQTTALDKQKLHKYVLKSIETSLKMLKIEKIDILQLHQSEDYLLNNNFFWEIINQIKNKEFFGLFGVSLYDVKETEKLVNCYSNYVDFVQFPYNVFDQRFNSLFPFLSEKKVNIISRSVFLKGIIPIENEKVPDELNKIKPYKDKLSDVSKRVGLSVAELALLFVVSNSYIHTTIVGVDSPEEVEKNVRVLEKLKYIKNVIEEIKELSIEDELLIDPRCWKQL